MEIGGDLICTFDTTHGRLRVIRLMIKLMNLYFMFLLKDQRSGRIGGWGDGM